jgi:glycerophosphoryl diester phosphodiesterase
VLKGRNLFFLILLFAALYVFKCISPVVYSSPSVGSETKELAVTGHRGAAGLKPENTLLGVRQALELQVDRIEIDVHQTRDSVIVLMHDKTLERTTSGAGEVMAYVYRKLQELKTGMNFGEYAE